jgi:hypothetical protein
MTTINWDDLAARFRLAEQVGLDRYNELYLEHRRRSVIATLADMKSGRSARALADCSPSGDTGWTFSTQAQAEAYAR